MVSRFLLFHPVGGARERWWGEMKESRACVTWDTSGGYRPAAIGEGRKGSARRRAPGQDGRKSMQLPQPQGNTLTLP